MAKDLVTISTKLLTRLQHVEVEAMGLREKIVELEKQIEDLKSSLSVQKGVTKIIAEKTISLIN